MLFALIKNRSVIYCGLVLKRDQLGSGEARAMDFAELTPFAELVQLQKMT